MSIAKRAVFGRASLKRSIWSFKASRLPARLLGRLWSQGLMNFRAFPPKRLGEGANASPFSHGRRLFAGRPAKGAARAERMMRGPSALGFDDAAKRPSGHKSQNRFHYFRGQAPTKTQDKTR